MKESRPFLVVQPVILVTQKIMRENKYQHSTVLGIYGAGGDQVKDEKEAKCILKL